MSAPNPGRFSIVVSVSRMHFSSSGGLFGKCGFRRTSCRIIVIICDRAVVCSRCSLLCSLFRDGSCAGPAPVISPHSSSLSIGLWVSWMFVLESWADIASRGWVSTNFVPDYRHHMWPRCCLLSAPITLLVVLWLLVRCACSSDLPPLLIALDRFVGVSCVLRALPVFSVVVRVPALWAARTRAVLERNRGAACFRGCCRAPPTPLGPCYLLGALWKAQEPTCTKKSSYRAVSF